MSIRDVLRALVDGQAVAADVLDGAVESMLEGTASPAEVGGLLVGLRMKGETADEIVAVAKALRARMQRVPGVPVGAIDTCGTGGDGAGTFNVSTAAALVVAGAGLPVAKHGNRAVSGRVGSADVLEALGVRFDLSPEALGACVRDEGIAFLYAPALHPAMRAVAEVRRSLGVRTIFNLVGPLANPGGVRRQVIGVSATRWLRPMAEALQALGAERAWVVHGHGGLDELALDGRSRVVELREGRLTEHEVDPQALGLPSAPVEALRVGSVAESVTRIRSVLAGEAGPGRDIVCLNAAAALVVGDRARDLAQGLEQARSAIDSGAAAAALERLGRAGSSS